MTSPADNAASAVAAAIAAASAASATAAAPASSHLANWDASQVLAVIAALGVIAIVVFAGWVVKNLPEEADLETRKIHFAGATFTGILMLFVFAAILYFADKSGSTAGKDIFEKAVTAITPLAGVIVGYLFGTRNTSAPPPTARSHPEDQRKDGGNPPL